MSLTIMLLLTIMVPSAFAVDDMWTVANTIIVDVYSKIAGISTVLAGLMSAVAVVGAKISNNQHKVDQAWDWLKRIWIAWAIINGIGAFIAYIMFYHSALSPLPLMLVVCILAVLIITAFVIYDSSKDEEEDQLLDVVLGDPTTLIIDPPKNAAPFRERCDALIDKFQLSSREGEVFRYLAKGRNGEYIQQ